MCQIKRKRTNYCAADMTIIIWKLLCFILLSSCSTAYPTRNPIEEYTDKPTTAVRKFEGEFFGIPCPDNWTLTRNTSTQVKTRCGIDWGKIINSFCHIRYLYPWHTGTYWCENKEGTVTELVNLTVTGRPLPPWKILRGAIASPIKEPTYKLPAVHIFHGDRFFMSCPYHSDWTVMRNNSKGVRTRCAMHGGRKLNGTICQINHMEWWHTGVYWCEKTDGAVDNLISVTVIYGSLLLRPSAVPIVEGDNVVLTCRTLLDAVIEQKDPVRFYKDNVLIGEHAGRRMSIHNFSCAHAGFYKCAIKRFVSPIMWLEAKKMTKRPAVNAHATGAPIELSTSLTNRLRSGSLSATVNGVPVTVNHFIMQTCHSLVLSCNDAANASKEMTVWAIRVSPFKHAQRCGYGSWGIRKGNVCDIDCVYPWDSGLYFCKSNEGESEAPLGLNVTIAPSHVYSPSHVFLPMFTWLCRVAGLGRYPRASRLRYLVKPQTVQETGPFG